jgi:hypothetical protein
MTTRKQAGWLAGCGLMLILTGCGVKIYPVDGEVRFADGKPLDSGTIVFELIHDDPRERQSYPAEIAANGSFRLEAPPGGYRVMIAPLAQGGPDGGSSRNWTFDEKFASFEKSELRFTVTTAEASNHCKFTITPPLP